MNDVTFRCVASAGSGIRRLKAAKSLLLGVACFWAAVGGCANDDSSTPRTNSGGSAGSSGDGATAGADGGEAAGATGGNGTGGSGTGGTRTAGTGGKSESGGEGGSEAGGSEPTGGAAGESVGGAGGAADREPTPEEICAFYCPPGEYHPLDILPELCSSTIVLGGAGDEVGQGGGGGGAGGYDPAECFRSCLLTEVDVAPVCGDEAMLYRACMLNVGNWVCTGEGTASPIFCDPVWQMLNYCMIENPLR